MAFKRALWVPGFPEREDAVGSGTRTNNAYGQVNLGVAGRPLMVELVSDRPLWVFRGAAAPVNTATSFYLIANTPTQMEVGSGENMFVRRAAGNQTVNYSVRVWVRE